MSVANKRPISVVLLHYPMTNRQGETVATSVTNIDLHDIARSCRTYEVDHYFIVTPLVEQHPVLQRIIGHWHKGKSLEWHPDRAEALARIHLVESFDDVKKFHIENFGADFEVVMPDARQLPKPQESYDSIRARWAVETPCTPKIIVFGTGWGIAPDFFSQVHTFSAPIYGPLGESGYNHLSVRSAVAIILDKLFGFKIG